MRLLALKDVKGAQTTPAGFVLLWTKCEGLAAVIGAGRIPLIKNEGLSYL